MIDPSDDHLNYVNENNQLVFINYEDGLEKMIISIGIKSENNKDLVWIFPVPANPNKVVIDVVKDFPWLIGKDITKKSKLNLDDILTLLLQTQIYTTPFLSGLHQSFVNESYSDSIKGPSGFLGGIEGGVRVYEHFEKDGITSEIITAKTANGIIDYLKNKGLKINNNSIPVLDHYIGKDYSFVVSWINKSYKKVEQYELITKKVLKSNEELINNVPEEMVDKMVNDLEKSLPGIKDYFLKNPQDVKAYVDSHHYAYTIVVDYLRQNKDFAYKEIAEEKLIPQADIEQRGVFVTFPTKNIYFPLIPTSVYGSKIIPAIIKVIGYVSPRIFDDIKTYTNVEYYFYNHSVRNDDLKNFYGHNNVNKYTKIEINAPSKFLTKDLWMDNKAPIKTYYTEFIAKHPILITILMGALISILSGVLSGWILFKNLRKKILKLSFVSLFNFFTIYGLLPAIMLLETKNKDEGVKSLLLELKEKGYPWKRRLAFVLFFIATPFLSIALIAIKFFMRELVCYAKYDFRGFIATVLVFYVAPILLLVITLKIEKIKPEDKELFEKLKLANYSSWSFYPKDKKKYLFIPLFSVIFLLISWLFICLLKSII